MSEFSISRGEGIGELNLDQEFTRGDQQRLSLSMMFGLLAAREALEDAGWRPSTMTEKVRSGVSVGMGMVDLEYIGESYLAVKQGGRKVSPYFVPRILPNLAAGHISIGTLIYLCTDYLPSISLYFPPKSERYINQYLQPTA